MLRSLLLLLTMTLAMPSFASAYNVWNTTKSTSPTSLATSITAPANSAIPGYNTNAAGNVTYATSTSAATIGTAPVAMTYAVAEPVGFKLLSVKIDGVTQTSILPGNFTVAKGTKISHTISATYATANYTIAASVNGTGGTINPVGTYTVKSGGSKSFVITPWTGYTLSGLSVGGTADATALAAANADITANGSATYTFSPVTASTSLVATFTINAQVQAAIAPVAPGSVIGTDVVLDGSASTNNVAATYTWAIVSPAVHTGVTLTPSTDGKTAILASTAATDTVSGAYVVSLTLSASGATTSVVSRTVTLVTQAAASSNACIVCHSTREPAKTAAFSASVHATQTTDENTGCSACHTNGADTMAAGTVDNCINCHNTLTGHGGATDCISCHGGNDAHAIKTVATTNPNSFACATCHTAQGTEFVASNHWITVGNAGGHYTGTDPTVLNEEALSLSCMYRCHFKATDYVAGSVLNADGSPNNTVGTGYGCTTCHSGALTAGGISTNPLSLGHNTAPAATVDNTCLACHSGSKHGWSNAAFTKSTHFTGAAAIAYYQFDVKKCLNCHDSHNPEGSFAACNTCHTPGGPYGIYANISATILKAPHGGGVATSVAGGNGTTQFITNGAICSDCHAHNNTVNAGFAEGGHGKVSSDPMNAFAHYNWANRLNDGSRSQSNCDRCHTAGGFAKLLGDTATATRLAPVVGQPSSILNCKGCHEYLEGEGKPMPGLRINATPAGGTTALSAGYFALFSSSAANLGAGNTKHQVAFPGFKNSSICVPCHSGRTTDSYVRSNIATMAKYSTLQLSNYQHAANMGQTFIGKGAWEFTPGRYANFATNQTSHSTIGMGTGQTSGPCVGCHHSETSKTHSLEVNLTSATCTPCHTATGPNMTKFEEFAAARSALDTLVRSKMAPLWASGSTDLNVERGGYFRYGRFGKAAGVPADRLTAQNAYGAVYNWQLVQVWDSAAWAHNPAYAKQIIFDTLAYLQSDGTDLTGSAANVTAAIAAANAINATVDTTLAGAFVNGSANCVGCHEVGRDAGAGYVQDNNGVRAITAEFAKRSHHVTGRAVKDSDCAVCHLEGKKVGNAVVVDTAFHMKDDKIYLRNGNVALGQTPDKSTAGAYVWNPAAPDHTLMDQYCFSCHNAAGAPTAFAAINGVAGYTGTALNPFGDSISNDYDQVSRLAVVNAYDQFDTNNSSHHAVRGQKYTKKNLTGAEFTNISTANANFNELGVNKPIKGVVNAIDASGQRLAGTMYETGKFVSTYTTLNGDALADDNTLHCGDCHTVGQFRAADVNIAVGSFNKTVIGAHGSNNEYMLRNSNGDDTFAKDALVCFVCHQSKFYNSDAVDGGEEGAAYTGIISGAIKHNAANSGWDCNGLILNSAGKTGMARLQLAETEDANADGTLGPLGLAAKQKIVDGKYGATSGSPIFGYSCAGCHNASDGKTFGGIHGNAGNASYTTYSGAKLAGMNASTPVQRKPYRFMPGLGNFRYNGGDNADAWMVKTVSTANKQGCYTLNGTSARGGVNGPFPTKADLSGTNVTTNPNAVSDGGVLGSWGACTDHAGTSVAGGRAVTRTILRPLTY
jgi:hypothetical protein